MGYAATLPESGQSLTDHYAMARRDVRIAVRCTPDERHYWTRVAAQHGHTLADWIRHLLRLSMMTAPEDRPTRPAPELRPDAAATLESRLAKLRYHMKEAKRLAELLDFPFPPTGDV